ncbi:hypothetical protein CORC01_07253 [Colletotrichum orchidophilum]|uniref:Uncharacterized protein n=1 Tax=Colletotrichum orchidophilum TaxID=1209926 RepID=A0A1G4B7S3_9PEZI|nr:uncharacterized protein CORC01_07253 [Colletotrichum orchidophilum]OHE97471.1 hypothetical protein CORC01_07253 [Colletotrichum orchidophilum]
MAPFRSYRSSKMELMVPADGKLHAVVGRTLEEQSQHQVKLVTKLLAGPNGFLTHLPSNQPPSIAFWNKLRQGYLTGARVLPHQSDQSTSRAGSDKPSDIKAEKTNTALERLLKMIPVGREIIAHLWLVHTPSVGNLASTSKGCSDAVAIYVSRFNLPSGSYQDCDWLPSQLKCMDEAQRATIGIGGIGRNLFVRGKDPNVETSIKGFPTAWASIVEREKLNELAEQNRTTNHQIYMAFIPFLMADKLLNAVEESWRCRHEEIGLSPTDTNAVRDTYLREMNYNIPMLRSLCQYGGALRALQLHEVPMMDLRMVELVLSACPVLEALGIVKCELLHVADVNPLLDILYRRSKETGKKWKSLQFYPRSYIGPLYNRTGTHIVSWDPLSTNVETSLLITVFWAIMKAIPLGIDLVSEGQAFRKFLDLVPMVPGEIAVFLHHVHSWLDKAKSSETDNILPGIAESLEDQVLLSMLLGTKERKRMEKHLRAMYFNDKYECCRCGCEMLAILFRSEMKLRAAGHRVCRICDLRLELDGENHHRLHDKRTMMDHFLSSPKDTREKTAPTDKELLEVLAPPHRNPFIAPPYLESICRAEAIVHYRKLPKVQDLIDPDRNFDILGASGQAAVFDADEKGSQLCGIYLDHPTLTQQTLYADLGVQNMARIRSQSWEHVIWKNYFKDAGLAAHQEAALAAGDEPPKPAGFW